MNNIWLIYPQYSYDQYLILLPLIHKGKVDENAAQMWMLGECFTVGIIQVLLFFVHILNLPLRRGVARIFD